MAVFEYILVFLTLVLGLGLTRNLTTIAEISIRRESGSNFDDLAWLVSIIFLQIDFWFAVWFQKQFQETWPVWEFLYYLAVAISLFMAGAYVTQATKQDGQDLIYSRQLAISALITWLVLISIQVNVLLSVFVPLSINIAFVAALALLILVMLSQSRPALYRFATIAFLVWSFYLVGFLGSSEISNTLPDSMQH